LVGEPAVWHAIGRSRSYHLDGVHEFVVYKLGILCVCHDGGICELLYRFIVRSVFPAIAQCFQVEFQPLVTSWQSQDTTHERVHSHLVVRRRFNNVVEKDVLYFLTESTKHVLGSEVCPGIKDAVVVGCPFKDLTYPCPEILS
jgi:hypothetical protein